VCDDSVCQDQFRHLQGADSATTLAAIAWCAVVEESAAPDCELGHLTSRDSTSVKVGPVVLQSRCWVLCDSEGKGNLPGTVLQSDLSPAPRLDWAPR